MATASGEEGRMGTRSRSSTSPELVHHPLNPRVVGWQGWKGGSRGFETGDSWAGFVQSVSVKRMKVCGRRRGTRVVEALRASWQSFAAASQRFQDPGRNRNRNARATNRGPRLFAIQWVAAESRAFVDPLGFAIWAGPPERLPTLQQRRRGPAFSPSRPRPSWGIQHQRLEDGPRGGRIAKSRAIPHLHPPVPFGDQSDHRL